MKRLIGIELLKLRTTPALFIAVGVSAVLTVASVVANIALAGHNGAPALGTVDNVSKVFSIAALSTMVAMAIGIVAIAGEYRHRTIAGSFLAEPRRHRVLVAKLAAVGGLGVAIGATTFGLAYAIAVPMFAAKGIHHLPIDVPRLWLGTTLATACFGLLGVALGALTRNTVAAIIGAIVWVQLIEVGILQHAIPTFAKWLPTGAGVALTSGGRDAAGLLSPMAAALVLTGWAGAVAAIASRLTINREIR
jgi:ABC-2 type transport system permease protein